MGEEKPQPAAPKQTGPPKMEIGRRGFLQFAVVLGGLLAVVPYVPVGRLLTAGTSPKAERDQQIFLEDGWVPGNIARGKPANIHEAPTNSYAIFVYPRTGDLVMDREPFRTYVIIRLPGSKDPIPASYPKELLGDKDELSSFRVYSRICVHLYCLPAYAPVTDPSQFADPERDRGPDLEKRNAGVLQCPCHGSMYRIRDGLAVAGPAWRQTPPNNALPALLGESRDAAGNMMLDPVSLKVDDNGYIYVKPDVKFDVNDNGVPGLGRWINGVTRAAS